VTVRGCKDGEVVEADEGVQATADVAATLAGSAEERLLGGKEKAALDLRSTDCAPRAWNAAGTGTLP
jgi:hypothetical protein